jgi:hypothetical protein
MKSTHAVHKWQAGFLFSSLYPFAQTLCVCCGYTVAGRVLVGNPPQPADHRIGNAKRPNWT